jgi:hypothetical protein
LNLRYQRTHRMLISRSNWRPLKRLPVLGIPVRVLKRRGRGKYASLLLFALEPRRPPRGET